VRDEFVHLEPAVLVVLDEAGELGAALHAAEGAALPDAAGDKLECYRMVNSIPLGCRMGL
jgi:hypothetical protein